MENINQLQEFTFAIFFLQIVKKLIMLRFKWK